MIYIYPGFVYLFRLLDITLCFDIKPSMRDILAFFRGTKTLTDNKGGSFSALRIIQFSLEKMKGFIIIIDGESV